MKEDLTDVTVVLDRSGSMQCLAGETIEAFNGFLAEQKAQAGEVTFSLVQFDDEYETVQSGVPLGSAAPLTEDTFVPRGSTALLDALGLTIDRLGARLAAIAEPDRPARVVVVLMTDGQENASRHYGKDQVTRMVREQEKRYAWTFIFLGAGLDAIAEAARLGMSVNMASGYRADGSGIAGAYRSLSRNVTRVRTGDRSGFTQADRKRMN
jgi:uncharacterized protein YegL